MAIETFKKHSSENQDLNKVQSNIEQFVKQFSLNPLLDGVLVKNIALTSSTTNVVSHKLGRKPIGFLVVRKRANSVVWDEQDDNKKPESTLLLNCSANVTIDLWVF